ncbi:MAG: formate acetyltransferase [Chloroflexi bacterium]|nr:formate acetyltransferase [Chloroflexota bacterium]
MLSVIEKPYTSERFQRIKRELLSTPVYLCPERAYLITDYFKHHDKASEPVIIRKAKATRYLLENKSVKIYPDELIAGNMGSYRISALMQPELSGVFMGIDIPRIDKRKTTPLRMPWKDRLKILFDVMPYWLFRNMPFKAFYPDLSDFWRYVKEQLNATYYLINEAGGIGHFLPDYEKMLKLGINGYLDLMKDQKGDLYRAAGIVCEGLVKYANRLADEAGRLTAGKNEPERKRELLEIVRICRKVPQNPAGTFQEALQSLWLTHMAICLEGINSAISFGRMDQYLYPYYKRDVEEGRITPEKAKELLLCFSAKATEHVFLLSEKVSQYHGGYLVVQAAIIGGMDKQGIDATNELTYIFLDVMQEAGLRDPNYQARIHSNSPVGYVKRVADVARGGNGVPAVFNDEAAIKSLVANGSPLEEARNYAVVGCVELALPGKSFFSTDAALMNLPMCLELALNSGRQFKGGPRIGAATPDACNFKSVSDIIEALKIQMNHVVDNLTRDLHIIEKGNRDWHPTPFSSMLVGGCLESGKDVTAGGALYNQSGIQGVGLADVADSLAALDEQVFRKRKYTMKRVIDALKHNFGRHEELRAAFLSAPKYGNDDSLPDSYALKTAEMFYAALIKHVNTRGGRYVPGFYSVTCHVAFGSLTGALPNGRRAGEPFAASLGASNGRDRTGVTALLNSAASIDPSLSPNGYALNLRFDPPALSGDRGLNLLTALMGGFFEKGGMEVQMNVIDPDLLEDARRHPGKYPGLVVRVAGYCAYYDDLPESSKREIIARTRLTL